MDGGLDGWPAAGPWEALELGRSRPGGGGATARLACHAEVLYVDVAAPLTSPGKYRRSPRRWGEGDR